MTSATAIIYSHLSSDTDVTAVVPVNRIYPVVAPQTVSPPYITITQIDEEDHQTLLGAGQYYVSRVEISIVGLNATFAVNSGEIVKHSFDEVIKASIAGATSVDIMKTGVDFVDYNDTRTEFRRLMEFYVYWRE